MVLRRPPKGTSSRPPPADPETLPRVVSKAPAPKDSAPLPRFHTEESAPVPDVEKILAAQPLPSFTFDPAQPITLEPESFDTAPTNLRDEFSEAAPTKIRETKSAPPAPKKPGVLPRPGALHDDASLDDVVEELREATGHAPAARELSTSALVDESPDSSLEPANSTMEVNVSDLMIDRPPQTRDLWNVRQAQPRAPMHTVRVERPKPRSSAAAIIGIFIGAGIVFGVLAFLYLRMRGVP